MSRSMVALFASASGLSVANVYYAQPLLDALAQEFSISHAAIGGVITASQIGCALALLILVPLGDRIERRRLMLVQVVALMVALVSVGFATSTLALLGGMLAVGMLGTAMTQGLIAYAATAAAPNERGRVVGAAQGGVLIGVLLARVLSGVIADIAGWRAVYLCSAGLMLFLMLMLWRMLPLQAPSQRALSYVQLLGSMARLLMEERVLQIRGLIAMLMFAAFFMFWSALVLPLSAAPYSLSHAAIGAFGVIGAVGAFGAMRAGRLADRGLGQRITGFALALMVLSWLPLWLTGESLWYLVLGIILLDLAGQSVHVINQSMIFKTRPEAHSRLVACYMLFYSVGSASGAIAATTVYAAGGWKAVCVAGMGVSLSALCVWAFTLRLMPPYSPVQETAAYR
jgi:predicted MFS family arabinose efflux permease